MSFGRRRDISSAVFLETKADISRKFKTEPKERKVSTLPAFILVIGLDGNTHRQYEGSGDFFFFFLVLLPGV